jgi:hypothetical protein
MARKTHSLRTKKEPGTTSPPTPSGAIMVASWEDDPGDPKVHPGVSPIQVSLPNQSARPLPFKLSGRAPSPQVYQPGTAEFLYYANASALRRTANFWGTILPSRTKWHIGAVLPVNIDSGVDLNAFYTRGGGGESPGLHFFHDAVSGRVYFSGESPDVACHEMGHAVLDAIRPQLFNAQTIETAAFHESFGDMSALLSALQVPSFRQTVLNDTGGKLNRSSRLSRLAEQLGAAIRVHHPDAVDADCLRNASNSFFYRDPQILPPSAPASQLSSEPHSFSRVFSAAFLDALAGMFSSQASSTADSLLQTSEDAAKILVGGILNAAVVADYYSQVAANVVQFADGPPFNGKYRDVLKGAFVRRGILSLQAAATISGMKAQTMQLAAASQARSKQPDDLPQAAIAAAQYGLKQSSLRVHIAAEPKRLAVSGSAVLLGALEPRSSQNAAESYTEDLFQRGHVEVGKYADTDTGLRHPSTFKTHIITEEDGQLALKRLAFDCGFRNYCA